MRIVLALDSFKGSITAAEAVRALAAGWHTNDPEAEFVFRPMADGGEGTLAAFEASVPGARRMPVTVDAVGPGSGGSGGSGGPGGVRDAHWVRLPDGTGVVELAATCGIELYGDGLDPWGASTRGLGQAIAAALEDGVQRLVIGIGSSASTDGGAGMLQALGARLHTAEGRDIAPGLTGLRDLAVADLSGLAALPPGGVTVLADVTNPLCGPRGAAAVFGPQKGLAATEIADADALLARYATLVGGDPAAAGAGAAGGTGYALSLWGARLTPGAPEVAALVGLRGAIAAADRVVTGEGSYDGQSAAGKVPSFVAAVAAETGVPVDLVAGRLAADAASFARALSLTEIAGDAAASLAAPARWLARAGALLAAS